MNKSILFLTILSLLVFLTQSVSAVNVTACQTINTSGIYTLNQSVSATGSCFNVTVNDVLLEGDGFNLTGNGTGIAVYGNTSLTNITVRDFNRIEGFGNFIVSTSWNDSSFTNNTLLNFSQDIILSLASSSATVIDLNTFTGSGNTTQICVDVSSSGAGVNITNNVFVDCGIAVRTDSSTSIVSSNNVTNSSNGLSLQGSSITAQSNNVYNSTGYYGVSIGAASITFSLNNVTLASDGLRITAGGNSVIQENTLDQAAVGINISTTTTGTTLYNNNVTNPTNYAILHTGANSTNFYYNNSDGQVQWTNTTFLANLTLQGNLTTQGGAINISNNSVFVNASQFSVGLINTSSVITFPTVNYASTAAYDVLRDGIICIACVKNTAGPVNFTAPDFGATYTTQASSPPGNISGLSNQSATYTSIYWNWTNPTDVDFNGTIIYIDGTNVANLSSGTNDYNATNLSNGNHTIRVNTIDLDGNINTTNITNNANTTIDTNNPSVLAPLPAASSTFSAGAAIEIAANATDAELSVDTVLANVSYPNGTINQLTLAQNVNKYNISFTIPSVSGLYNVTYIVNDTAGNINDSVTTNFTVTEVDGPNVTAVQPTGQTVNITENVTIEANVSDESTIHTVLANVSYPNGSSNLLTLSNVSNVYNTTFTIPNVIGLYNITFIANDTLGNVNNTIVANFTASDPTNPVVTAVLPSGQTYASGASITVQANVTDTVAVDTVLANVSYPNGSSNVLTLTNAVGALYNGTFTIPTGVPGTYNVTIIANDTSNNVNDSVIGNFTVNEDVPPTVLNETPVSQTYNTSDSITIEVNVTDASGVHTVLANVSYPNGTTVQLTLTNTSDIYNTTFVVPNITGLVNITFIANDTYGNVNSTVLGNFTVIDSDLPAVTGLIPAIGSSANTSNNITLQANVTDNVGVHTVLVNVSYPNGTIVQVTLTSAGGDVYNNTIIVPDITGTYNFTYIANDTSGNTNESEMTNATVGDGSGPAVIAVSPTGNQGVGTSIVVEANVSDASGTIDTVLANVSYPNGSNSLLTLTNTSNVYNTTFTVPNVIGVYNITFIANDTAGNVNNTVTTSFTGTESVNPNVTGLSPSGETYNTTDTVTLQANVSDNFGISSVIANVSYPNGTYSTVALTNSSNVYSGSFTIPNLAGTYTFAIIATDTSSNVNSSVNSTFIANDGSAPLVSFASPTPSNGATTESIAVNVTSTDEGTHYTFVDFDSDLNFWMRFDDVNSSGDPTDISSLSNNGSLEDNATINTTGYFGDAAHFDGDGDYVTMSNVLANLPSLTVSLWAKFADLSNKSSASDMQTLIVKGPWGGASASDSEWYIVYDPRSNNNISFTVSNGTANSTIIVANANTTFTSGSWHHIVATWNSSYQAIYVNGSLQNSTTSTLSTLQSTTHALQIGAGNATDRRAFNGSIDEVLIFNRSLATAEVSSLYNASANQYYYNFTPFIGQGSHTFTAHSIDLLGLRNSTSRSATIADLTAPVINLTSPQNTSYNVTSLSITLTASFSEPVTDMNYSLGNTTFNTTSDMQNTTLINTSVGLLSYGNTVMTLSFKDSSGNVGSTVANFNATLVIPGGTANDTDGDGINNTNDTLIGNGSHIYTDYDNLSVEINSSTNLSQLFNETLNVSINNGDDPIVTFLNDFGNNTINLTNVSITTDNASNLSKIIIRGLSLQEGNTKTVYLTPVNSSNNTGVCVKDAEISSFSEFSGNCTGTNETYFGSIPSTSGAYSVNYTNTSNTTIQITGVTHSGIQQICSESWTCGSWSTCSSSSQSRSCTDANACGTTHDRPALTQSCTSESSSSSSSSGGSSSSTTTSVSSIASESFTFIEATTAEPLEIETKHADFAFTDLVVTLAEDVSGVTLNLKAYDTEPTGVDAPEGKLVYQYLVVTPTNLDNDEIQEAVFSFMVPLSWLTDNGAAPEDVRLYHEDDEWVELSTTFTSSDASFAYYTASSSGFSAFAIVIDEAAAEEEETSSEDETVSEPASDEPAEEPVADSPATQPEVFPEEQKSGASNVFAWVLAIVIIIAGVAYFVFRRKGNNDGTVGIYQS